MLNVVARGLKRAVAATGLATLGYGAAGLVGGAIPVDAGWRPPQRGVVVWIESNGVHTDLLLPKVAAGVDWRDLARPREIADPRYARWAHVAIGWGDRRFFLQTPSWTDVRPGPVLRAVTGDDETLLHVEHVPAPARAGEDVRRVVLTPDEYRRLAAFVRASVAPGGRRYAGYGPDDAFVDARGRYGLGRTCNEWTGAALRAAGVRMGAWTPFPATVLGWFPPDQP